VHALGAAAALSGARSGRYTERCTLWALPLH